MTTKRQQNKKLQSASVVTGMWNGMVSFTAINGLVKTQIRVHVGLADSQRIQNGASAEKILAEIIEKSQGYNDVKIVGVISDKAMKKAAHPFKK